MHWIRLREHIQSDFIRKQCRINDVIVEYRNSWMLGWMCHEVHRQQVYPCSCSELSEKPHMTIQKTATTLGQPREQEESREQNMASDEEKIR